MTQGVNENGNDPDEVRLAKFIIPKINDGKRKTQSLFHSAGIFKVPESLRKLNRNAYTPQIIAIGPLHRKDKHLQTPMQHVKMDYTDYLLERVAKEHPVEKFDLVVECVKEMKACVEEAKKNYAAEVMVNDDQMSEIMFVDGCFILELLFSTYVMHKRTTNRGESGNPKVRSFRGESGNPKMSTTVNEGAPQSQQQVPPTPLEFQRPCPSTMRASSSSDEQQQKEDPILGSKLTDSMVQRDLILLENQIPFFVLEKLFELTLAKIPEGDNKSLREYVVLYFGNIMRPSDNSHHPNEDSKTKSTCCCWPSDNNQYHRIEISEEIENQYHPIENSKTKSTCCCWPSDNNQYDPIETSEDIACMSRPMEISEDTVRMSRPVVRMSRLIEISEDTEDIVRMSPPVISTSRHPKVYYHILHVLHDLYAGSNKRNAQRKKVSELEVSALDLDYAGIKFQPTGKNMFDIKFVHPKDDPKANWWCCRGKFLIPTLNIDDLTEPLFRNLIAFEQFLSGVPQHFTCYANLMDSLIDSEKDVQVLKKFKVIHNYLGKDEDVADLFNNLCKEIIVQPSYLNDAYEEASDYSGHRWPAFLAFWERKYFSSPVAFIGFSVAFAAFAMQFITFVLSFL